MSKIKKAVPKEKWLWMPHAGHLIVGNDCRFHLNTKVGKYIVSTVGEYNPDQVVKRIHAEIHNKQWYLANAHLKGDYFDVAYQKEFGYDEIGAGRKYETMVFKARKAALKKDFDPKWNCCPWVQDSGSNIDFDGYNTATDAYQGHLAMCRKWARK